MSDFDKIRAWAHDRNIILGSSYKMQLVKLVEELGELAGAIAKNKQDVFIDSIGDIVVVLTIMAEQGGVNIEKCIEAAYNDIKDRKGRMEDGIFVKEEYAPVVAERCLSHTVTSSGIETKVIE